MFFALLNRRSLKEALPYSALSPTSSDEDSDYAVSKKSPPNRLGLFAIAICTCLTVVNIVLASRSRSHVAPHLQRSYGDVDIESLRRPSQFIGLDTVVRPTPPTPRNITIYPTVLAQIDERNPHMIFDDDPKHYTRRVGTISLEDRRVQITDSVSTIVQFRAIDFGMELCELQLKIAPRPSSNALHPVSVPGVPRAVSVYRLAASAPLNTATLNYRTRPSRVSKVADVRLDLGSSWSRRFHCVTDQVLSFELAASSLDHRYAINDGLLEWWQNKDGPESAVLVVQHATL